MSVKKQMLPRCTGVTRDASQCGRRASDFTSPALCHLHRLKAQGQSNSPLTQPMDHEPIEILKKLTRSSDERVRLRAVDLILELARKDEEKKARTEGDAGRGFNGRQFLDVLTAEERDAVAALTAQLREIQRVVYQRHPRLAPAGFVTEDRIVEVPHPSERCEDVPEEAPSSAEPLPATAEEVVLDGDGWEEI